MRNEVVGMVGMDYGRFGSLDTRNIRKFWIYVICGTSFTRLDALVGGMAKVIALVLLFLSAQVAWACSEC